MPSSASFGSATGCCSSVVVRPSNAAVTRAKHGTMLPSTYPAAATLRMREEGVCCNPRCLIAYLAASVLPTSTGMTESLAYAVEGDARGMASIACFRGCGSDASSSVITCSACRSLAVYHTDLAEPVAQVTLPAKLHCLAVNPAGTQAAVADDSHYVKVRRELLP